MKVLAKNIQFLRKRKGWSQEKLAHLLEVKRSSIASYESKNVEPRISLILKMAKLFKVSLSDLVESDIRLDGTSEEARLKNDKSQTAGNQASSETTGLYYSSENELVIQDFISKSEKIQKMLEGFKIFYKYKLEGYKQKKVDAQSMTVDIENFIMLIEHLLSTNNNFVDMFARPNPQTGSSSSKSS